MSRRKRTSCCPPSRITWRSLESARGAGSTVRRPRSRRVCSPLGAADRVASRDLRGRFDRYLAEQKPLHVWVAEVDGRVAGFTGALDHDQRWELEPIVVDRPFRAGGVGSALVAALVDAARAAGKRGGIVHPAARNAGALRFFHGHGFDVLGQIELVLDLARPERW